MSLDMFNGSTSEDSEPSVYETYRAPSGKCLSLKLTAEHSLWAHKLWNAAKVLSDKMFTGEISVVGKRVLELGAGAGLPSLTASLMGASYVLATDYPDEPILDTLRENAKSTSPDAYSAGSLVVQGYIWGTPLNVDPFDEIFMSDLIFNHREHTALVTVIKTHLKPQGTCRVLYSHHVPPRRERDLQFFQACEAARLKVTEEKTVFTDRMFPEDDGMYVEYPLEWRQNVFYRTVRHGDSNA
ncbi:Nicotinamide N-methyltransferase [Giardia muris]|uniref:Nicotinamide N-methyltransferase n=1 Tax=Giardia muris TaxID=5742 RepID=A0A4Z1TC39_GIAMU|nr:Nicotinamide N-methyltransferase [Giardia muris]|eukprot:TNJ30041.1 Nicotinamide N-methyltransferase [Giardia muris]